MVDLDGPVWPYRRIADDLAARIVAGDLVADERTPSESQLCAAFGVARGTARHAVAVLRDMGLVVTVPRRGAFVVACSTRGESRPRQLPGRTSVR